MSLLSEKTCNLIHFLNSRSDIGFGPNTEFFWGGGGRGRLYFESLYRWSS